MLSRFSRILTFLNAAFYAVLGLVLFLFPGAIAPLFAWKVSPFVTMTMGGWCLGNAWLAWITARRWEWRLVYTALIYLWLFGPLELLVLFVFRSRLSLAHPVAWLYVATLLLNTLTAQVGLYDWLRTRPALSRFGPPTGKWARFSTAGFVVFVGFLALYGLLVPAGGPGTNGGIFPEVLSSFTLRAFAVFYLSLTLGVVPLLWDRNQPTYLHHAVASYGLVVAITIAAFAYIGLFDLVERPGGLVYIGAYLIVGIPLIFVFLRFGTGSRAAA
jgi:hypothetical protein